MSDSPFHGFGALLILLRRRDGEFFIDNQLVLIQLILNMTLVSGRVPHRRRFGTLLILLRRRDIGNLLRSNQRQRRTCYALCHILYPVWAAHTRSWRVSHPAPGVPRS